VVLLFDWSRASRGDLALLRHAINADWPIPNPKAAALMEAMSAALANAVAAEEARRKIAVARVYLAADWANLRDYRRG
jgi:hypothetical protein